MKVAAIIHTFLFSCSLLWINLEQKSPNNTSYWIYMHIRILYIRCGVLQLPLLLGCICLVMLFITIVRYSVLFP